MHKALLIYNPSSGRRRERRAHQVEKALAVFRAAGVEAECCATTHSGSAVIQTHDAVSAGFDTLIACGGDGTANEILNGLMHAQSDASLGVLPFGSGNVLATDLLLRRGAEKAARALLSYKPCALHPGLMRYQDKTGPQQRYFIVVAGVGSDAELMYRTVMGAKERYGVYAYFLEMLRMAIGHRFSMFRVEWKEAAGQGQERNEEGSARSAEVAMVMAVRVHRFPGLLSRVRLDVELRQNHYRLMLFRTNKVRHFLNYFGSVMSGINWKVQQVELAYSTWFRCTPLGAEDGGRIHSEVDGELLGTLPVEVTIAPTTFNLLMPP